MVHLRTLKLSKFVIWEVIPLTINTPYSFFFIFLIIKWIVRFYIRYVSPITVVQYFFHITDPDAYLSIDFSEIINNITLALLSVCPKSHYYSGLLSRSLPFLYLHLPSCIGDPVMSVMGNWFEFVPKALSKDKFCQ